MECRKVVEEAIEVFQKHLSKSSAFIDAKQRLEPKNITLEQMQHQIRQLRATITVFEQRVSKLEEIKVEFGRSMAEFYKKELINVRIKYDKPLMRSAFDQVDGENATNGIHQKKKKRKK